ncbi:MAG: universal stress protein [Polyangiaceae bacterium]
MRQPIVVGIDLTEASDEVLRQAAERAARDRVPLTVVHTLGPAPWGSPRASGEFGTARRALRTRVAAVTGRAENTFEVVVDRGAPHLNLARIAAARGAILVVGGHLERRIDHAFLRDVSERVVARARPVYVVQPKKGSKRVLVALAHPLDDAMTLETGIEEARASGSALVVMHSVHMGFLETMVKDLVNGGAYAPHPLGQRSQVVIARRLLSEELRRRGVSAEVHVVDGNPALMIPEVAIRADADLIVMGTPPAPAPVSHVTTAVLRHAPCSVLVVDACPEKVSERSTAASNGLLA